MRKYSFLLRKISNIQVTAPKDKETQFYSPENKNIQVNPQINKTVQVASSIPIILMEQSIQVVSLKLLHLLF